jgi:hypothetical protein
MRKYGVENINDHFISFNTICDATQVILSSILMILLVQLFIRVLRKKIGQPLNTSNLEFPFSEGKEVRDNERMLQIN